MSIAISFHRSLNDSFSTDEYSWFWKMPDEKERRGAKPD